MQPRASYLLTEAFHSNREQNHHNTHINVTSGQTLRSTAPIFLRYFVLSELTKCTTDLATRTVRENTTFPFAPASCDDRPVWINVGQDTTLPRKYQRRESWMNSYFLRNRVTMVFVAKEKVVYVVTWDTEEYKFSRNLELWFLKPREREKGKSCSATEL